MKVCPVCDTVVKNLPKHFRRKRCLASHVHQCDKPIRGLRGSSKEGRNEKKRRIR